MKASAQRTLHDLLVEHRDNPYDNRTFGLLLPGGGMRGAYTAGAIEPLIEYDLARAFDHIIGVSAGAINGAYLMSADKDARHAFVQELTNKTFVNLLRRERKIDVDFLVDVVLKQRRPLDLDRVRKAHAQLHIMLTDAITGKKQVVSDHHAFVEIYEELRATSALPILYDRVVPFRGRTYIDGGVADGVPVDVAAKLGCTDVVVVMTQPLHSYRFDSRHTRLERRLVQRFAKKYPEAVRRVLPTDERLLRLNLKHLRHPVRGTNIYLIEPSDDFRRVTRTTIDRERIVALAEAGVRDMDRLLYHSL